MSVAPSLDLREGETSLVFADMFPWSKQSDFQIVRCRKAVIILWISEVFPVTSERKDSRKSLAVVQSHSIS